MSSYSIEIKRSAAKELAELPTGIASASLPAWKTWRTIRARADRKSCLGRSANACGKEPTASCTKFTTTYCSCWLWVLLTDARCIAREQRRTTEAAHRSGVRMNDRLSKAVADRYRIEREIGAGGLATV